jgi:segregation and condensation protein A
MRKPSFKQFEEKINFFPDSSLTVDALQTGVLKVLQSLKELDNLPKARIKEAISIQEKIDQLQTKLSGQIETKLSTLLTTAKNKSEVIVTFLALLELIKQKVLVADQEMIFADVTIKQYSPPVLSSLEEEYNQTNHES